jgi:hypothetical protein
VDDAQGAEAIPSCQFRQGLGFELPGGNCSHQKANIGTLVDAIYGLRFAFLLSPQ